MRDWAALRSYMVPGGLIFFDGLYKPPSGSGRKNWTNIVSELKKTREVSPPSHSTSAYTEEISPRAAAHLIPRHRQHTRIITTRR